MPVVQRLGYLLDLSKHRELTEPLHELVEGAKPKFVRLEEKFQSIPGEAESRFPNSSGTCAGDGVARTLGGRR